MHAHGGKVMIAQDVKKHHPDPPQAYVVLGMHRSATSAVAYALEQIGIDMNGGAHHWEDLEIMRLNDRLLRAAGGSWHMPPSLAAVRSAISDFSDEACGLIHSRVKKARSSRGMWGFKDPRTCLTWELWEPLLEKPIVINVYRDPIQVAESIRRRDGFPLEKGIELAKYYNRQIGQIMARINGYWGC